MSRSSICGPEEGFEYPSKATRLPSELIEVAVGRGDHKLFCTKEVVKIISIVPVSKSNRAGCHCEMYTQFSDGGASKASETYRPLALMTGKDASFVGLKMPLSVLT